MGGFIFLKNNVKGFFYETVFKVLSVLKVVL